MLSKKFEKKLAAQLAPIGAQHEQLIELRDLQSGRILRVNQAMLNFLIKMQDSLLANTKKWPA